MMMSEDSTNGISVPHVRKTSSSSRSGSSSRNMNNSSSATELLAVAAGNAEASSSSSLLSSSTTVDNTTTAASITTNSSSTAGMLQHQQQQQYQHQQQHIRPSQQQYHLFHGTSHNNSSNNNNTIFNLYRLYDVRSMDIQSALDQMKTLLSTRPQLIYKTAYYRKQTKNHWYRDDPAFVVIQIIALVLSCIAYSIAFKSSIVRAVSFLLTSIGWNYLIVGILTTSILREFTNRHLLTQHHHPNTSTATITTSPSTTTTSHIQKQQVEWFYAFDIHCNAFFPLFMVLYVVQFFSMPITLGEGYIPLIIGNTLYAIAFSWYWYITHLGYRALPFLSHTEIFLFPITIVLFIYLLMMIGYPFGFGYNMTRVLARFYFI